MCRGSQNSPFFYHLLIKKMFRGKNYLTKTSEGLEVNSRLYLETLEKLDYKNEEELEKDGYIFSCRDNSENYEDKRIITETMARALYIRKNPKGRGYNYAVEISIPEKCWVYNTVGIYKTNENCFQYLVWLCDARHLARLYNFAKDFHKSEIEETKKEL